MRKKTVILLALLVLAAAAVPRAEAAGGSATIRVSATILPALRFSAQQLRGSYEVTAADLKRGYVDLPGSIAVQVQANFIGAVDLEIAGAGEERIVFSDSRSSRYSLEVEPVPAPVGRSLDLRVMLSANAREGIYPLQASLQPLAY